MEDRADAAHTASQHVWRAQGHLVHGRIGEGIEALDAAARALTAARNDRAYVRVAERILALSPNRVEMWRGLAYAQLRWGNVEAAGDATVAWLALRPHDTDAIECMAEVFGRRGRRGLAAQTLARLGQRALDAGRDDAAAHLCERARSWSPDEPEVGTLARELACLIDAPVMETRADDCGVMPSPRATAGRTAASVPPVLVQKTA